MSDTTPILGLPELSESQQGKSVSHNEALNRLEGVLVRVLSATTTAQPGSPSEGDAYILPASATGADWAGNDGKIAHYYGAAWHFYAPVTGLGIYSTGDAAVYRYGGATWASESGGGASDFVGLDDTPTNFTGAAGKLVAVNIGETALEYVEAGAETPADPSDVYRDEVLIDAPVLYWRVDEASGATADDASGNAYDGAYNGTPSFGITPPFGTNDAVDLDGSTDIRRAAGSELGNVGTTDQAIELWAKYTGTGLMALAALRAGGTNFDESLLILANLGATGSLTLRHANQGVESTSTTVNDGAWHHIVCVVRDTTAEIWIDGVLDKSATIGHGSAGANNELNAGNNYGGSQQLTGSIDEFALYLTDVPSAARIEAHYAASSGASSTGTTLVGHNYLINPDLDINQRGFAGGALADGVYGYDRWKANGASTISAADGDGYVTLTSGALEQVIESPGLAGKTVTLAADTGGTTVTGTVDGQSGPLPLTVNIDSASTGDITVKLAGGKVKNVRLIGGYAAGTYQKRPISEEIALCERYFQSSYPVTFAPGTVTAGTVSINAQSTNKFLAMGTRSTRVAMRASPTVTFYSSNDGAANRIYNQNQAANRIVSPVNVSTKSVGYPLIDAGDTAPAAGDIILWHWTAEAEL